MEKKAIFIIVFTIFLIATIPGDEFLSLGYILKTVAAFILLMIAIVLLAGKKRKERKKRSEKK